MSEAGRGRLGRGLLVGVSLLVLGYVVVGGLLGRATSEGAYRQLQVFAEVLNYIHNQYVDEPDLPRVTAGALHGLLAELDPYSSYLGPNEYAEYRQKRAPAEGEVGLVLSKRFGLVSVVGVVPNSPAARAGLQTNDLVESISDFSTREMSLEQARRLLEGEPGTPVRVAVVRQQRAEPQLIELVRARAERLRVVSARLETGIGYLKIAAFTPGTTEEVRSTLRQWHAAGARKLVLDLRGAASGTLEEAVGTSRLLLARGVIAALEGQQFPRQQFSAEPGAQVWPGPVTVLINRGTAGAAEVVAAAVLDNGRGEVIGQRSYGVGSVQKLIPLEDGSALILTVAKYYRPAGRAFQEQGVTPSLAVEPTEGRGLASLPHAVPPADDPVLVKALEVLRAVPAEPSSPVRKAA